VLRPHALGTREVAADAGADPLGRRVELPARARGLEQPHHRVAPRAGGVGVRRQAVRVARGDVGVVLDQRLGTGRVANMEKGVPQLRVGWPQVAPLEQDADLARVFDRVPRRVRVAHRRPSFEQQLEAGRVVRLDGVVDGFAVVRIRAPV
jgi:hypothetical protein